MADLLPQIEMFVARHGMSDWSFGEAALNDRHLIRQLRAGRELRRSTEHRVRAFMETYTPAPVGIARASADRAAA